MRLYSFNGVELPSQNANDTVDVSARSSLVDMRNGAFDMDGGNVYLDPVTFSRQGWFIGDIETQMRNLLQEFLKGRGILRAKTRDGVLLQTFAKIRSFSRPVDVNTYDCWQPYTVRFEQDYPYWMDERDGRFLDSGYSLNSGQTIGWTPTDITTFTTSPRTFSLFNYGNAPCPFMFIDLICGAGDQMVGLQLHNITNGLAFGINIVGNNERLRINTLAKTVTINFENAYNQFQIIDTNQTEWMSLEPGRNDFTAHFFSVTGSPTLRFKYSRHSV